jgi:hypothetical protein
MILNEEDEEKPFRVTTFKDPSKLDKNMFKDSTYKSSTANKNKLGFLQNLN